MHIKSITLCGFGSYRDLTTISGLHEGHNAFVGINGSGKSTIFKAIAFVLGDSALDTDTRRSYLHNTTSQVVQAYVELVIDNSDKPKRLDDEPDEVVLRRTIGHQKDQWFKNHKPMKKSELDHMLELAGFSRSNPYYIVAQNKVSTLARMSPEERLALLKEVAGTGVYERRREETDKLMRETEGQRTEIEKVLEEVENRHQALEQERTELKDFQEMNTRRRAIEYCMYDREVAEAREALAAVHTKHEELSRQKDDLVDSEDTKAAKANLAKLEEDLRALRDSIAMLEADRDDEQTRESKFCEEASTVRAELEAAQAAQARDTETAESLREEQQAIAGRVAESEDALKATMASLEAESKAAEGTRQELNTVTARVDALNEKSTGGAYRNKKDRDRALGQRIKSHKAALDKLSAELEAEQAALGEKEAELGARSKASAAFGGAETEDKEKLAALEVKLEECKREQRDVVAKLEPARRKLHDMENEVSRLEGVKKTNEALIASLCPRDARKGYNALMALKHGPRPPAFTGGIRGRLVDLVRVDQSGMFTPMQKAVGNQLFSLVVDDLNVAQRCVEHLRAKNAGRLTAIPLREVAAGKHKKYRYPDTPNAVPLVKFLSYDPELEPVVQQEFGKFIVCKTVDEAVEFVTASDKLTAVTPDGVIVKPSCEMRSGYVDPARNVLRAVKELRDSDAAMATLQAKMQKESADINVLSQALSDLRGTYNVMTSKRRELQADLRSKERGRNRHRSDLRALEAAVTQQRAKVQTLESKVLEVTTRRDALVEVKGSAMAELTAEETAELEALEGEQAALEARLRDQDAVVAKAQEEVDRVQEHLRANLNKALAEVTAKLDSVVEGRTSDDGFAVRQEVDALQRRLGEAETAEEACKHNLEALASKLNTQYEAAKAGQEQLDDARKAVQGVNEHLQALEVDIERVLQQRREFLSRRDESVAKLREVGAIPADVEEYRSMRRRDLRKALDEANKGMRKFDKVNKKALSQFQHLSDRRDALRKRREELAEGRTGIEHLTAVLDQKKSEAILRTFKDVSAHFSEVFTELTGTGKGELVMVVSPGEGGEAGSPSVEEFTGVDVKVSLAADGRASAMSGGQQTLVALALIFAVQRTDPAPFTVMDEVDAPLDPKNRHAVARLIHKQAHAAVNPSQFITSTFREELAEVADAHFGVQNRHQLSVVTPQTREECLEFIAAGKAEDARRRKQRAAAAGAGDGVPVM